MVFDFGFFAALAFVLGVKHAFDADHVVAISNILARQRRLDRTLALSTSWAVGHLVTAALVSAALYYFADTVLPQVLGRMEFLVPLMLLAVGLIGLAVVARRVHLHRHEHEGRAHRHVHVHLRRHHEHGAMAGIGVVHGLASNDELLLVLVVGLGATAWWQVFLGVALFSLGVVLGMTAYSTLLHVGVQRTGIAWLPEAATALFSLLSVAYAVHLLVGGTGFNLLTG